MSTNITDIPNIMKLLTFTLHILKCDVCYFIQRGTYIVSKGNIISIAVAKVTEEGTL